MSDLLIEIGFIATEYYSTGATVHLGGIQYLGGIIVNIPAFSRNQGEFGEYEEGRTVIEFVDFDRHFRAKTDIYGASVLVKTVTGTLINTYTITDFGCIDEVFYIECTDKTIGINGDIYAINEVEFPGAPESSIGQYSVMAEGPNESSSPGTMKAWRADYNGSPQYLARRADYGGTYPVYWKIFHGTTDITSSVTLQWEFIHDRLGKKWIYYLITYSSGTEDYLTYTYKQDEFSQTFRFFRFFENYEYRFGVPVNYPAASAMEYYVQRKTFYVGIPGAWINNLHYEYSQQMNGIEFLQDAYNSTFINSRFNSANQLELYFIEYNTITAIKELQESAFLNFEWKGNTEIINTATFRYRFDSVQDRYLYQSEFSIPDSYKSQDNYGKSVAKVIDLRWIRNEKIAAIVAKHHYARNDKPRPIIEFTAKIEDTGTALLPGSIIAAINRSAIASTARYYLIMRINYDHQGETVTGQMQDIQDWTLFCQNCLLLIHSWKAGPVFFNSALNSECEILPYQDEPVGTNGYMGHRVDAAGIYGYSIKGFGADINGGGMYLKIDDYDDGVIVRDTLQRTKWDMLQNANYSIFFFFKIDSTAEAGNQNFIVCRQSTSPLILWFINYVKTSGEMRFGLTNTTAKILMTTSGFGASTTRHSFYFVKSGSNFGIYIDGVQMTYASYSGTDSIFGPLYIMQNGDGGGFLNGTMEEVRIGKDNPLNAAPVVGLTDTVTVPTNGFNFYGII